MRTQTRHPHPRRVLCSLLVAGLLAVAGATPAAEPTTLLLETTEQRPWQLPAGVERIAIADPEVADLVTTGNRNQALLVGKRAGRTTIMVWQRGVATPQRIVVEVRSPLQQQLLSSAPGAVSIDGQRSLLQGSMPDMLDHARARSAAASSGASQDAVIDASTIAGSHVVQVEVRVVEFSRKVLHQLGVNFQNSNGGFRYGFGRSTSGGSNPGLSSAFNLVFEKLLPGGGVDWAGSLNLLQSNGMARVLAEPTLVALSGQSASFLAGGELPILEPQGLGTTTVSWKPFGIGLTVTPTVLSADRIALKVAPEASDLDYANGIVLNDTQIPAITTRRADTTVELGDGESFIIGGLVSNNISSNIAKVPLLGHLPIIGAFFRNLNYSREERELVIVVTPHLVRPIARNTPLSLPGDAETAGKPHVWGSWLLHPAGSDELPGFSR